MTSGSTMTSWPWLKGIDVAIADPIEPLNRYDDRPAVKDLIAEHRSAIDEARSALAEDPLYNASKHDDLWILRFVLSHSKGKPASKGVMESIVAAAKHTLQFRKDHKLDIDDIRDFTPSKDCKHPKGEACKKYLSFSDDNAIKYCVPDPKRGVVVFLQLASIHHQNLVNALPEYQWLPAFVYMNEWTYQWLDYITRTTGRLTKCIRIANCEGLLISHVNSENQRREANVMGMMEDFYPQLLHSLYVCHAPFWIQVPWRMLRPFLPSRLVNKIDFISPRSYVTERTRLFHHISEDHLPPQFGGKNTLWPNGFVSHDRHQATKSSWIWMKGVSEAIADPVPLDNEHDKRPAVKDLIAQNRSEIDEARDLLAMDPLYEPSKHDDLFILRFVLTHGKKIRKRQALIKAVVEAATYTLKFRKEQGLDEHDLRPYPPTKQCAHPNGVSLTKYLRFCDDDAVNHCVPDPTRGVVTFLQVAGIHQHELVKHLPESDWLPMFVYVSEWSHQCLDYTSRTTGRYTKSIRLANCETISLTGVNMESLRRDTAVMAVMDDCYPDLLDGIFVCHPPAWIQIPWRVVRPILSMGLVAEFDFITPKTSEEERLRLLQHISEENLPQRFGGKNTQWPPEFAPPAKAS